MYEKFANWKNLPDESTPITAAALTHIEQGITDVDVTRPGTPAEVELSSRLSATAGSAEGLVQAERAARESALELKADKTAVYTKAETYTRAETGTQITNAITASRPPLYGTGFPNGVVAAPVGTLYSDAAVTNGASLWQKVSGTGASGWEIARADTGWRNILSQISGGWTASEARARRTATHVQLSFRDLDGTAATGDDLIVGIPAGWGAEAGNVAPWLFLPHARGGAFIYKNFGAKLALTERKKFPDMTFVEMPSPTTIPSLWGTN